MEPVFRIAEDVREAVAAGAPVVALETRAVAHGFPLPRSLNVAAGLDRAVRERGALPAFVGVLSGTVTVGLERAEVERLATGADVMKVSQRDRCGGDVFGLGRVRARLFRILRLFRGQETRRRSPPPP